MKFNKAFEVLGRLAGTLDCPGGEPFINKSASPALLEFNNMYIKRLFKFDPETSAELDIKVPKGQRSKFVRDNTKKGLKKIK